VKKVEEEEMSLYFTSSQPEGEVKVYYVSSFVLNFFVVTLKEGEFEQTWGIDSFSPQGALHQAVMTWDTARPRAQDNPFKRALMELQELEGNPPQLIPL